MTDLLKLNPSNILAAQIDNFTEEVGLNFVRTAFSQKYKDALEESKKPEGIEISVPLEHQKSISNEYSATSLNLAIRLHAFSSIPINGFTYMSTKVPITTDKQNIMYCKDKELIVVPLMDSKR